MRGARAVLITLSLTLVMLVVLEGVSGGVFIDLVAELRDLPEGEQRRMYIHTDLEGYRGAAGHYSAHGNAIVARALYERLIELPQVAGRLAELNPPVGSREGN